MTLPESLVVSLDYAKRLKEAGWPQYPSMFYWGYWTNNLTPPELEWRLDFVGDEDSFTVVMGGAWDRFAAPTAEEILRRLPDMLDDCILQCSQSPAPERLWVCSYFSDTPHPTIEGKYDVLCQDTLANAAAAMYCALAEHNLLPDAK